MHALLRCRMTIQKYRMKIYYATSLPRAQAAKHEGQSDSVPQQRYCRSPKVSGLIVGPFGESAGVSSLFPVLGEIRNNSEGLLHKDQAEFCSDI